MQQLHQAAGGVHHIAAHRAVVGVEGVVGLVAQQDRIDPEPVAGGQRRFDPFRIRADQIEVLLPVRHLLQCIDPAKRDPLLFEFAGQPLQQADAPDAVGIGRLH